MLFNTSFKSLLRQDSNLIYRTTKLSASSKKIDPTLDALFSTSVSLPDLVVYSVMERKLIAPSSLDQSKLLQRPDTLS